MPEYIFGKRSNNAFHILATSGENVIGVLERIFLKREGKSIILFTGKRRGGEKSLLDIINVVADKFDQEQSKVKAVLLSSSSFPPKKAEHGKKRKIWEIE